MWFRQAILSGTLAAGERLPSTRDLAEQARVSRTVVLLAYDQLLAEGFVQGVAGSGTYVAEGLGTGKQRRSETAAAGGLSRFGKFAEGGAAKIETPGKREKGVRDELSFRAMPGAGMFL